MKIIKTLKASVEDVVTDLAWELVNDHALGQLRAQRDIYLKSAEASQSDEVARTYRSYAAGVQAKIDEFVDKNPTDEIITEKETILASVYVMLGITSHEEGAAMPATNAQVKAIAEFGSAYRKLMDIPLNPDSENA